MSEAVAPLHEEYSKDEWNRIWPDVNKDESEVVKLLHCEYEWRITSLFRPIAGYRAGSDLTLYPELKHGKTPRLPDSMMFKEENLPYDDVSYTIELCGVPYIVVEIVSE